MIQYTTDEQMDIARYGCRLMRAIDLQSTPITAHRRYQERVSRGKPSFTVLKNFDGIKVMATVFIFPDNSQMKKCIKEWREEERGRIINPVYS